MNLKMIERLEEAYRNPDKKFCFYIGESQLTAEKITGIKQWDWCPQPTENIEPWYWQTHSLALAFGAKPIMTSDGREWIDKIISDPSQISKLKIPEVWSGRTGEILNKAAEMLRQLPEDTLIRLPDIQSPLGIAELLWDESFYTAFLLTPGYIHELTEKITEFIINYIKEFQKLPGNRLNPACHPRIWSKLRGYYISDDVNSMISPEQHAEFSIPYINKITEACGPVFYHSCTWNQNYFENFRRVNNKKVINWSVGSSADPAIIIREFSGEAILAPHIGLQTHTEGVIPSLKPGINDASGLVKYFLDAMLENTTMYMVLQDSIFENEEITRKIVRLFDERGYSPMTNGLANNS